MRTPHYTFARSTLCIYAVLGSDAVLPSTKAVAASCHDIFLRQEQLRAILTRRAADYVGPEAVTWETYAKFCSHSPPRQHLAAPLLRLVPPQAKSTPTGAGFPGGPRRRLNGRHVNTLTCLKRGWRCPLVHLPAGKSGAHWLSTAAKLDTRRPHRARTVSDPAASAAGNGRSPHHLHRHGRSRCGPAARRCAAWSCCPRSRAPVAQLDPGPAVAGECQAQRRRTTAWRSRRRSGAS